MEEKLADRPEWAAALDTATYEAYIASNNSTSSSSSEDEDDSAPTCYTISKQFMPPLEQPPQEVYIYTLEYCI